jgi:uncharacterized protein (TIGR02996 family)
MTEREAFLRAILEDPADDTPRLAFADWLTDQGEGPRAEFIRVQVELRQYPLAIEEAKPGGAIPATKRYGQLRTRERELLLARNDGGATNRWAWGHHVSHLIGEPWSADSVQFRRGFVESVTLTAADFLRHAEALFRAQPITRVTLSDIDLSLGSWHEVRAPAGYVTVFAPSGDTVEEMAESLSRHCVERGRSLAGLPPLCFPSSGRGSLPAGGLPCQNPAAASSSTRGTA